ncbi:MAG TPA: Fe-S-containing hydro-lyase [Clostridiaceae bacterium]|nr:Fe-S-containing hydro-lyase [Clostridiaceae bacterium]
MEYYIQTPLKKDVIQKLKAGDIVYISGTIYTARDAAHKRLIELIREGGTLPFDVAGQIIYYVGPCPAAPGRVIGSAGPTTSGRMDAYAPELIKLGIGGMIGKGLRSKEVIDSMVKYGSLYFGAVGGAAALISKTIVKQEVIAFPDLGTEAIRKLEVKNFPAYVIIDSEGNDLYKIGKEKYRVK